MPNTQGKTTNYYTVTEYSRWTHIRKQNLTKIALLFLKLLVLLTRMYFNVFESRIKKESQLIHELLWSVAADEACKVVVDKRHVLVAETHAWVHK